MLSSRRIHVLDVQSQQVRNNRYVCVTIVAEEKE